jgi:hypothetical protein
VEYEPFWSCNGMGRRSCRDASRVRRIRLSSFQFSARSHVSQHPTHRCLSVFGVHQTHRSCDSLHQTEIIALLMDSSERSRPCIDSFSRLHKLKSV